MAHPNASSDLDEKEPLILSESDMGSESDLSETESDTGLDEKPTKRSSEPRRQAPASDPRFDQPTPSPFKRAALIVFTLFLFWMAFSMRKSLWEGKKTPKVIYASRYSKEHRFRPAASPIITETLKDGRIRIRGAGPTATPTPIPKMPKVPKVKRKVKGKRTVKRKSKKSSTRK